MSPLPIPAFTLEDVRAFARWLRLQQPLPFVSIAAQKCHAESNGALGFSKACETVAQGAGGFPVSPTVISNIYHLSYVAQNSL